MTDTISKAAKAKAKELASHEVTRRGGLALRAPDWEQALARVLQEHSDKAREVKLQGMHHGWREGDPTYDILQSMILPDDPEPFSEVVKRAWSKFHSTTLQPQNLDELLAKEADAAGYEIRRKDG